MPNRACTALIVLASWQLVCADEPSTSAPQEPSITAEQREHWAYRPVLRAPTPEVANKAWPRHPLDAFVLRGIEEAELHPAREADRRTLIRRVTFDLTGLPPMAQEVQAFLGDGHPAAYERIVDRLLASPTYGERMAQHWLDLARFAETDGFEHDKVRPNAWRYRDWVIAAFNADLPYDQFVKLQLAADELSHSGGTGGLPASDRAQADKLPVAHFAALGFLTCGPDMPDINLQDERRHAFLNDVTATIGATLLGLQFGCAACHDHKYDAVSQYDFYRLRAYFDPCFAFARDKPAEFAAKSDPQPESRLMLRGDFRRLGPEVAPAVPRIVADGARAETRAALAEWLTRPGHPLATRVIANRLWQWHFGRGLAAASSDLGVMGHEPTHPKLLDWLATETACQGFSLKSMQRMLVTSASYRQASRAESAEEAVAWLRSLDLDPDNRLWNRMVRRRLSGEEVRDALLSAGGSLLHTAGGPGVRPPVAEELRATLLKDQWPVSPDEADHHRRSIYVFARRNLRFPIFEAFDKPDGNASCPQRNLSTTAPQALLLLNSEFSAACARRLAEQVRVEAGDDVNDATSLAFLRTLGRPPTPDELSATRDFLTVEGSQSESLQQLCLALLNLNEFVYVD